jgi:hypothetical protein
VRDVILHYPSHYIDFFAMATARTLKKFVLILNFLFLLIPLRLWFLKYRSGRLHDLEVLALISLLSLAPILAVGFAHTRYLARYFVPLLLLALLFIDRIYQERTLPHRRIFLSGSVLALALGVLTNIAVFWHNLASIAQNPNFWFPD